MPNPFHTDPDEDNIMQPAGFYGNYYRQTVTFPADVCDSAVAKLTHELRKDYDDVALSSSIPVLLNNVLHYTVTITAAQMV